MNLAHPNSTTTDENMTLYQRLLIGLAKSGGFHYIFKIVAQIEIVLWLY